MINHLFECQTCLLYTSRNVNNEQVIKGEQNFYKAKCHLCHVTTLHTKPRGSVLLNGTRLPWLGSQTIHPYSDFLLHDMGSEIMGVGLNDNYVSGLAPVSYTHLLIRLNLTIETAE